METDEEKYECCQLNTSKNANLNLSGNTQLSTKNHRYFLPLPLKGGKKQQRDEFLNSQNLDSEIILSFSKSN